jgi:hypothetical protein
MRRGGPPLRLSGQVPQRLGRQHRHAAQGAPGAEMHRGQHRQIQQRDHGRDRDTTAFAARAVATVAAPKATPAATESTTTIPVKIPGGDNNRTMSNSLQTSTPLLYAHFLSCKPSTDSGSAAAGWRR